MARINQTLLQRLESKLRLPRRQIYRLIERKVAETHLDRRLAAIVVASDHKINIAKYASPDDLATIRGSGARHDVPETQPVVPRATGRKPAKPNRSIAVDLAFVTDDDLRAILERDLAELNAACSQPLEKVAKTCMVLCGSITEALLLFRLSQDAAASVAVASSLPAEERPRSPGNPDEWHLNEMINVALRLSPPLLPEDAAAGAHQLRRWRNLIHPARELKEAKARRIKPTKERAGSAIAFLRLIAKELDAK